MTLKTASPKELRRLENKWVALIKPDDVIVGIGKDAVLAKRAAEKKGYRDIVLMKILPSDLGYAPRA
jgi:hypothetical protein